MKHVFFEGPEAVLHCEVGEIQPGVNLVPDDLADRLIAAGPEGRFRALTEAEDLRPVDEPLTLISEAIESIFDRASEADEAAPRPRKGKE
jgi:hypothetical protein